MSEHQTRLPLEIRLFGPIDVRIHGAPMPRLRSRKGAWLLALLVLRHDREVERNWLAGTLWPESDEQQAMAYLRQSLTNLRSALGNEGHRLSSPSRHTLRFDIAGDEADVLAFDSAIADGDKSGLERAVSLYRGPLLEDCLEDWALPERDSRAQAYLHSLETLADRCTGERDYSRAQIYLRRAISAEPLRESAHRALMQALTSGGDLATAIQVYRDLRLNLHRELRAEPDSETTSLFDRLRRSARRTAESRRDLPHLYHNSADSAPMMRRLPYPLTPLIGRRDELSQIQTYLRRSRLVTLSGVGGIGKTRLAIAAAHELAGDFPDGIAFVDLAGLQIGSPITQTVASALGLREDGGHALEETVLAWLESRILLLVLDNCEHLMEPCAKFVRTALHACGGLRIITTSRQPLGVTGEQGLRVPSLSFPSDPEVAIDDPDIAPLLSKYEAIRLFVDRAALVQPAFCLTHANALHVAQICLRLDGIPLALELAAARLTGLSVEQISQRLDDRFQLLTGGDRGAPPRHHTLRAAIDWSYELLGPEERWLLQRLSVFAGGWTLEWAEAVCDNQAGPTPKSERPVFPPVCEAVDLLAGLVDKSLVVVEESKGGIRYRLLETVRQFAAERLEESDESAEAHDKHIECFMAMAERAEPELIGEDQQAWLDRLEAEHDNLRASLSWALKRGGLHIEQGLRLGVAVGRFWRLRGHFSEGRHWLEALLSVGGDVSTGLRANALRVAGSLATQQGDYASAVALHNESLSIHRQLGNLRGTADALNSLGLVAYERGQYDDAESSIAESLSIRRKLGDKLGLSQSCNNLAMIVHERHDYEKSRSLHEESLAIRRELGDRYGIANSLNNLAYLAYTQGDYERSRMLHNESLAVARELEDRRGMAFALSGLGDVESATGDHSRARALHEESLLLFRQSGIQLGIALGLEGLAATAAEIGDYERTACLIGASESHRNAIGAPLPLTDRERFENLLNKANAMMGSEAFVDALARGRAMNQARAIDYALEEQVKPAQPA